MENGNTLMGNEQKKTVILVFAGPNGSGKSTVARGLSPFGTYVNADEIKKELDLTDLEAAQQAEALRNKLLARRADFSFETVLSTGRNLRFLEKAKAQGYEIYCVYVLTCDENINIARVRARVAAGGHDVPEEKIRTRYHRALALVPRLMEICDILLLYDNSVKPSLIFYKQGTIREIYPNDTWPKSKIEALLGL